MTRGSGFKILLTASEVVGFSKTGGLADVAGSLPRALEERGHSCVVVAPLYRCTRVGKLPLTRTDHEFTIFVGNVPVTARLWRATLPKSEVPVYLVEQTDYFERDDPQFGRGLYQFISSHGSKRDYPDNCTASPSSAGPCWRRSRALISGPTWSTPTTGRPACCPCT